MSVKTFLSVPDLSFRVRSFHVLAVIVLSLAACKNQDVSAVASTTVLPTPNTTVNAPAATTAATVQNSYADVVSRVTPAVVTVRSERRAQAAAAQGQGGSSPEDQLREFFGGRIPRGLDPQQPQPRNRRGGGLGSGVVVTPDGYILTNNHVVEGADTVTVELSDRRRLTAKVVGTDPPSDLAVLKIEASNLPVLPLGDSDRVRVGDVALAVGNPLGVGQTVTSGIISAKGRSTGAGAAESFEDFIQTDAPINSGNSGGALINTTGELVGINSQILSPTGGNIGIGFAIPSNMARNVMDQIVKNGTVRRSRLGIGLREVDADIAEALGLKEVRGVIVSQVEPGSPAERAGLKRGDVVTGINGSPAADANSFRNRIANTQPNSEITLTVVRDNREQQLRATLAERPNEVARNNNPNASSGNTSEAGRLGIVVEPLTADIARQLEMPATTQGIVVRQVNPNGPAAEAGIQQGDVIEEVNRQAVRSAEDLRAALQRSGTRPVLMLVNRGGNPNFVTVRPQQG